jgi:hypothetical protein
VLNSPALKKQVKKDDAIMKNVFTVFGAYSRVLCALALVAVLGFSFAACSNGSTDVVIPPEWHGTYKNNSDTMIVTATTIKIPNGNVYKARSDGGVSGNAHKYNFKVPGSIILLGVRFYNDKTPVYLMWDFDNKEYAQQP